MGKIVGSLFGGTKTTPGSQQQSSQGGFNALPEDIQKYYRDLIAPVTGIVDNAEDYFKPMSFGTEELQARQLLNPDNIQSSIQKYLNPFQSRVEQDINRQFEAPQSMLTQRASEAGAFGGSKYRSGQTDLERARLDALAGASGEQYNNAYDQLQQGISSLLGFGGMERDLDLQQRQALPSAIGFGSDILSRLLNANQSQGSQQGASTKTNEGLVSQAGKIASLASLFSDIRIKENVVRVGEENGYAIYEFNYIGDDARYSGVMAQDVEKVLPEAVTEINGIKAVNYGMIGVEMKRVA
jgi:hypothetical protein